MDTFDLAARSWYLDLEYLGASHLIACGVLETDAGLLLVDPGPATSLGTLERKLAARGASLADIHTLLLTHIHLDHAGAAGSIVAAQPHVQVYVHRRGTPHLINPERLLRSARRLYGDRMDELWGAMLPVPEANVHVLHGGETITPGGRALEVAYTPGHAVHHVSYLDAEAGTAFIGDTGGMRVAGADYVLPVTPPPDVHLEAWFDSLHTVRAWQPERLFVTHFGPSEDPDRHLTMMADGLRTWADRVRASLNDDADDATRAEHFRDAVFADLHAHVPDATALPYERFGEPQASWHGLARYWRKRAPSG